MFKYDQSLGSVGRFAGITWARTRGEHDLPRLLGGSKKVDPAWGCRNLDYRTIRIQI